MEEKNMEEKNQDLVVMEMLKEPMALGEIFAKSGMFPDIKSAAQGAVKILAGREIGLSPIQSINSFYFVGGRLGLMAQAMAALIKKSNKYDYQIDKQTAEDCSITFYQIIDDKKEKIGTSVFDKVKAAKAGIINKDNWKNYPENMYFARALANGGRWYCPDAISGFYTVEELSDMEVDKPETVVTIDTEGKVK